MCRSIASTEDKALKKKSHNIIFTTYKQLFKIMHDGLYKILESFFSVIICQNLLDIGQL